MGDPGEQRRMRLHLARQRPAPDRVRARIRDGGQSVRQAWWRRIDWVRWGTVVGVAAGIGSLLFTGVATYYGALVSRDQLQQSRDEALREARDHAVRVSYWTDLTAIGEKTLHVMNRSPDPVSDVQLLLWHERKFEATRGQIVLELRTLPPCSEAVLNVSTLIDVPDQGNSGDPLGDDPLGERSAARFLVFRDRDGVRWKRDEAELSHFSGKLPLLSPAVPGAQVLILTTADTDVLRMKPAASCGEGS